MGLLHHHSAKSLNSAFNTFDTKITLSSGSWFQTDAYCFLEAYQIIFNLNQCLSCSSKGARFPRLTKHRSNASIVFSPWILSFAGPEGFDSLITPSKMVLEVC